MNKYLIETSRLGLRAWKDSDLDTFSAMNSDESVMKYFPKKFRLNKEESKKSIEGFMDHYHKHGFTYFATDLLADDEFIGFIGMKTLGFDAFFTPGVDIGWRLSKDYWGRGLATEGAIAARNYFFEHFNYDKLFSLTPIQNQPSWSVMEKIGMEKIGVFDHPLIDANDELQKHVVYHITKAQWDGVKENL